MAAICLLACIRGRWPERLAAVTLALNWVGCAWLEDRRSWHHPQMAIFTIDAAYAVLLVAVAMATRRLWILFAAAFQIMIVVTHCALLVDARINQWEFFAAYYVWSYLILAALAAGAVIEGRRPVVTTLHGNARTGTIKL